jgi:hypothetical protein
LPRGYWQKRGNFHPFFSEVLRFCLNLLQVDEAVENFKNTQRFLSYICSFNYTTFLYLYPFCGAQWLITAFKSISQWLLGKMLQFPSLFAEGLRL